MNVSTEDVFKSDCLFSSFKTRIPVSYKSLFKMKRTFFFEIVHLNEGQLDKIGKIRIYFGISS
jgi:hypothetical protein